MMAHLALWIASMVLDAQLARNAVFPEATDSPVICLGALAMSAALDHLLLYEGCPLRGWCVRLVAMAVDLGPALCDTRGAMAEGCSMGGCC